MSIDGILKKSVHGILVNPSVEFWIKTVHESLRKAVSRTPNKTVGTPFVISNILILKSVGTFMFPSLAPHSLLFPCEEGALGKTYKCPWTLVFGILNQGCYPKILLLPIFSLYNYSQSQKQSKSPINECSLTKNSENRPFWSCIVIRESD